MKSLYKILLVLSASTIFFSCGKDKDRPEPQKTILLSKVTVGNVGTTTTFTYDDQKRMTKAVSTYSNPKNNVTYSFTYNSQDRLTEFLTDYEDPIYTDRKTVLMYSTTDGSFIGADDYYMSDPSTMQAAYTFEYSAGKIVRKNYARDGMTLQSKQEREFVVSSKNVTTVKMYKITGASQTLLTTTAFSDYDDKKNPNSFYPKAYLQLLVDNGESSNNSKKLVSTDHLTGEVSNYNYTYEYNTEGYVTKRISATGEIFTYQYTYQ